MEIWNNNQVKNDYLDHLIVPTFRDIIRLFNFSLRFGNNGPKRSFFFFNKYYISSVEIKNLNVIIDNKSLFEQPRKKTNKKRIKN